MKFNIAEIGYYDIILGIPWLYKYNPQIDWNIGLIFTIWHYKNRSILIGRDLAIGDVYKERDINKPI